MTINVSKKMKVFLGGTWNESTWRNDLIPMLDKIGINYFNPIVEDWNEEAQQRELQERETCDICLYCITPKMTGVYSIAEVIDDSNKRPEKTVFVVLNEDMKTVPHEKYAGDHYCTLRFNESQLRSLAQVGRMVERNGGRYFNSLEATVDYLTDISVSTLAEYVDSIDMNNQIVEAAIREAYSLGMYPQSPHISTFSFSPANAIWYERTGRMRKVLEAALSVDCPAQAWD